MRWKQGYAPSRTSSAPKIFYDYTQKCNVSQSFEWSKSAKNAWAFFSAFCSFERSFSFISFNFGSLNGKSMELCEGLLRRKVGIYCIREVRWRGMGSKFVGSSGIRFKLW